MGGEEDACALGDFRKVVHEACAACPQVVDDVFVVDELMVTPEGFAGGIIEGLCGDAQGSCHTATHAMGTCY